MKERSLLSSNAFSIKRKSVQKEETYTIPPASKSSTVFKDGCVLLVLMILVPLDALERWLIPVFFKLFASKKR